MSEGFGGIKDTLLLDLQEKFSDQFEEKSYALSKSQSMNQFYASAPRYVLEIVAFGSVISLIIYLIATEHGELDYVLPIISIYALAGFKLLPALQNIYHSVTQIRANTPAFDIIKKDLSKSFAISEDGHEFFDFEKNIELENIHFSYPDKNIKALTNISLSIEKNQCIAFVGSSGSGKSTLVDILLGLINPDLGNIFIDGTKIDSSNLKFWQNKIGYVPQQIFLSDQTIAENIAFGIEQEKKLIHILEI